MDLYLSLLPAVFAVSTLESLLVLGGLLESLLVSLHDSPFDSLLDSPLASLLERDMFERAEIWDEWSFPQESFG